MSAPRTAALASFDAAAPCRHCGDPCGAAPVVSDDGAFCCQGCAAVFSILAEHGLTAFYTCDVNPGFSQKRAADRDANRFAALDDPAVAQRLVESEHDGVAVVRLAVPSLHCASCVWLIEQLWKFDRGIVRAEADLLRRTVLVEFRPARTTLRAVAERLAAIGYEPVIDPERTAGRMPVARRDLYLRIGLAGFAFGNVMLFSIPRYVNGGPLEPSFQRLFDVLNVAFAFPVLVYSAAPYFRSAWIALRARAIVLDVPIALGLAVLFARSVVDISMGWGEGFLDSFSGLVFFLLIGRLFQQQAFDRIAFDRTVRSFFPLSVRVERSGGTELTPIDRLAVGDTISLRPQEVVPADAVLVDAAARVDYAFVTGEAAPVAVTRGETIAAGGRIVDRAARLAVARDVSHSRLAELWNNPVFAKAKTHWLTGVSARFGWWFTVTALALAAAGVVVWWPQYDTAASVATAVLIIACPCALTLAAPMTLGTAMGQLGRAGLYLKHPAVALDLSQIDTITFDKTGTLTNGDDDSHVTQHGMTDAEWRLVRRLAAESVHPVSRAIAGRGPVDGSVSALVDRAGEGVSGCVDGVAVAIGTAAFVARSANRSAPAAEGTWTAVGPRMYRIDVTHAERPGMIAAVEALATRHRLWLLSGDHATDAAKWGRLFGERLRFRLTPDDKLAAVREQQAAGHRVLMVGDGLNDAGALAAADVGMAVSDDTACLVPACDAVIRGDRLTSLPHFLQYARRARQVLMLCFAVSVAYNAIGLTLALMGRLTPLVTAIFMPVSSLTIVGLSIGLMRRAGRAFQHVDAAAAPRVAADLEVNRSVVHAS